jgi:hypothetical protein
LGFRVGADPTDATLCFVRLNVASVESLAGEVESGPAI